MTEKACGVKCGVLEWVKRSALRWYGHVRRMKEERMVKKVYQSDVNGVVGWGRPPLTWENMTEQFIGEE